MNQGQKEFGRFMGDIKANPAMFKEFETLSGNKAAWFDLARSKGYHFTQEDVIELGKSVPKAELSDADLEKVAGGWSITCTTNTINPTLSC